MIFLEFYAHFVTCPCWAPSLVFFVVETGGAVVVVLVALFEFSAVAAWVILPFGGAATFVSGWACFSFFVVSASAFAPPAASGSVGGGLARCRRRIHSFALCV